MHEIECTIFGRVQMVMYRDFAARKAHKMGVRGVVQNLSNGTVRVIAQGEEISLKKFIELLRKGSILSRVENMEVVWRDPQEEFKDFSIRF